MNFRKICYEVIELNKKLCLCFPQISCCNGFMYSSHEYYYEALHRIILNLSKNYDYELYDYLKDFHYSQSELYGPAECNIECGYYDSVLNMCKHDLNDKSKNYDDYMPMKEKYINVQLPDENLSPLIEEEKLKNLFEYKAMLEYTKKYVVDTRKHSEKLNL